MAITNNINMFKEIKYINLLNERILFYLDVENEFYKRVFYRKDIWNFLDMTFIPGYCIKDGKIGDVDNYIYNKEIFYLDSISLSKVFDIILIERLFN